MSIPFHGGRKRTRATEGVGGPLRGVRAVFLSGMGPVPVVGMMLADMGAEVVRITRPANRAARALSQTDGLREDQDIVNRGVDSMPVDLKDPDQVRKLLRLVSSADLFVEGYRPGVVERLGLGPEVVLGVNPGIVYGRLTGYGQTGPMARQAGHDINYVAQSGALHAMARVGEAPHPPINLLGDYAGGAAIAAFGLVTALFEAKQSGRGQVVDAAMVDGVALLTSRLQGLRAAGLYSDEPGTNILDGGAPFYDTYRCSDGRYIAVGALEPDFYQEFISRLGVDLSDWPEQEDRAEWPRLRELIGSALAGRTQAEWSAVFEGTDACACAVLTFDEAATHPHNAERGTYQRVDGVLHPSPAPRFSRTPTRPVSTPTDASDRIEDLLERWDPVPLTADVNP